MSFDFTAIEQEAEKEITQADSLENLENVRLKYLGRQGILSRITGSIPELGPQERPEFGRRVNLLKNNLAQLLEAKTRQLKGQKAPVSEKFDFGLPGILPELGALHPITQISQEVSAIFSKMGFVIVEGPEIESEYNNFTALNIPMEHPSRDAFDTFYIRSSAKGRRLLRSHTSPVQIRMMQKYKPPLAVIVPGKVYRPDAVDASHSFMFHQVEGFLVDDNVRFSDLRGILTAFLKKLFGENTKMRFRPHFFPFTEPSAEVDISCVICKGGKSQILKEVAGDKR